MSKNYVSQQLVYWGHVTAAVHGAAVPVTYAQQNGPGLLTGLHVAAGIYPITMGPAFGIPLNRRMVVITTATAVADASIGYDPAASTPLIAAIYTYAAGVLVNTVDFMFEIYRVEMLP